MLAIRPFAIVADGRTGIALLARSGMQDPTKDFGQPAGLTTAYSMLTDLLSSLTTVIDAIGGRPGI
jgi:hypothetical protein